MHCFAFIVTVGGSLFQTSMCLHICVYALSFLRFNYAQEGSSQYFSGSLWSDIGLAELLVVSIDCVS